MADESRTEDDLLRRLEQGDEQALNEFLARYRDRLRRMVKLRIDTRLQGRIDPSDVIQEAYLEATIRIADYLRERPMPLFLWLRFLTSQQLLILHRRHAGAEMRDVGREISLHNRAYPKASSAMLAAQLVGDLTSPSNAAIRAERRARLQAALNDLPPIDREIIALRHFEQLSRSEAAEVLGIDKAAASKRYVRALERLREFLRGTTEQL